MQRDQLGPNPLNRTRGANLGWIPGRMPQGLDTTPHRACSSPRSPGGKQSISITSTSWAAIHLTMSANNSSLTQKDSRWTVNSVRGCFVPLGDDGDPQTVSLLSLSLITSAPFSIRPSSDRMAVLEIPTSGPQASEPAYPLSASKAVVTMLRTAISSALPQVKSCFELVSNVGQETSTPHF